MFVNIPDGDASKDEMIRNVVFMLIFCKELACCYKYPCHGAEMLQNVAYFSELNEHKNNTTLLGNKYVDNNRMLISLQLDGDASKCCLLVG